MVIRFVSLFLGLVLGPQTVVLEVTEPVARADLHLDGRFVGRVEGPLWHQRVDLGEELAPHELVAIAFDDEGHELGSTRQWLNLPRQPTEATVVLESGEDGRGGMARIAWQSLLGEDPSAVRVDFDGRSLEIDDPRSIPLPPYDPEQLHFLRVHLDFADTATSTVELVLGGTYLDRVSTELTSFAVQLEGRKSLPPIPQLQEWFTKQGQPLRAVAVEKGPVELMVVRDGSAWKQLRGIRSMALTDPARHSASMALAGRVQQTSSWFRSLHPAWGEWTFQFFWPVPRRLGSSGGPYDLFPHSPKYSAERGSLHGWATTVEAPSELEVRQRLADAVAVAAVTAAAGNRRRAVLLILGDSPEDASDITPGMARRFLRRLRVPLFVWTTLGAPGTAVVTWGDVVDVSSQQRMQRATRLLFDCLERQRIVWIDGAHLPQEVELGARATGIRLAGEVGDSS